MLSVDTVIMIQTCGKQDGNYGGFGFVAVQRGVPQLPCNSTLKEVHQTERKICVFFCTNTLQIRIGASLKKCFHHLYFILSSCLEKMSSFLHI